MKNYFAGIILVFYFGLLGYLYLSLGHGDTYPAKPISIIVHSKPGSAIDYMARKVSEIARKYSKVPFVIENRSGTQGLVAMKHVLDNKADGYTLLGVTKSFLSTVMVNKSKVKLDDFLFVANMVSDPEAIISNEDRDFNSIEDIIIDSKQNQKQVWIGPGTGSRDHLMALKSWEVLKIDASWIDYKSAPQSILALLRDESAVYVGNPADIKGKSGLKIISIASDNRLSSLPDIPTFKEQGYDLSESMWRGFAFKKGVQDEAIEYVTKILQDVVNDEEWKVYCDETNVFSNFEKHIEFTQLIEQEVEETNYYLNKAGLLATYQEQSQIPMLLILFLIVGIVFLLILAFNKFIINKINYNQIIAGGIISISLFFYYQTMLFSIPENANVTNPALIPRIWIIILLLLSVILIFNSKNKIEGHNKLMPGRVVIIIAFLIVYLISMQWIGYFFTTPVFILSTMYLLLYRKPAYMIINAFGFVMFSYFIFNKLLHIDLPLGWLFI
ncbi:MAG: tripartite tricarboxylate transporter TctB family protein [Bacteroidetes bacterium]|nr:tripartite tricarboxylate transporter TctB family protein [Bacteroidota bacterium]